MYRQTVEAKDKLDYLNALQDQYTSILHGLDTAVKDYDKRIMDRVGEWNTLVVPYVEAQSGAKKEAAEAEDDDLIIIVITNEGEERKSKEEASYKPKDLLCSEDAMIGYEIWEESARTYFMMSGQDKKPPEQAYAIFIVLLDLELRKMFKEDWKESGKTTMMDNMSVLGDIFEAMYPLNTRRPNALELKQWKKVWSSWIADYGSAWEEAKMSNLTMDQFKAIMAGHWPHREPLHQG